MAYLAFLRLDLTMTYSKFSQVWALRVLFLLLFLSQEESWKQQTKSIQVSYIGFIFPNLGEKKLCQSICTQIAGVLWSLAAGRALEGAFSAISILHGGLLSAGAIILL